MTSPFLQASAAASAPASEQRGQPTSDRAEDGGATAIEVGKPLPKSVAPLYAVDDDDCSSGTESDSSFGSRLLDHEGELNFDF